MARFAPDISNRVDNNTRICRERTFGASELLITKLSAVYFPRERGPDLTNQLRTGVETARPGRERNFISSRDFPVTSRDFML